MGLTASLKTWITGFDPAAVAEAVRARVEEAGPPPVVRNLPPRERRAFDRLVSITSLIGAAAPDFWVAIVAIVVFAVGLGWLPTSGVGTAWHWILPVGVLFIRPFGIILQIVRGSMVTARWWR